MNQYAYKISESLNKSVFVNCLLTLKLFLAKFTFIISPEANNSL